MFCDHSHESDYDDDKLLLDDENTNKEYCVKCRRKSNSTSVFGKPAVTNLTNDSAVTIVNESNGRLIENGQIENIHLQDFHCHSNVTLNDDQKAWKKLSII